MASFRQIQANRRNALASTGPKTEAGKKRSRFNAIRHGLTAETVIDVLEDPEDYKAFELSVASDFDAQTAVERELVLRLASLLWRLRRATAIETGLLQIQAKMQGAIKQRAASHAAVDVGALNTNGSLWDRTRLTSPWVASRNNIERSLPIEEEHSQSNCAGATEVNTSIGRAFLRLATLDGGAFERLNRYEAALWRQIGQLIVTLDMLQRAR